MPVRPEIKPAWIFRQIEEVSEEVFFKEALAAVKKRRGLIHGKFKNGGVCALGALAAEVEKPEHPSMCVPEKLAQELQDVNDSVPDATNAERRTVVIAWLKSKLGDSKSCE